MTRLDFIPGTMCDERVWAALLPHLPADCRAHFVPLQRALTRRAMRETIAQESAEAAHLVAFSMGGYLALEHALSFPQRVRSLTIIAASAKGLGGQEKQQRLRVLEGLKRAPFGPMPDARMAQFVHPSRREDPAVVGTIRQMYEALGERVLAAQITQTMERPSLVERLAEIACPVLIVGAENDQIVEVSDLEDMHRRLPRSELCVFPHTGHMIPLEQPERLGAAMARFMSSLDADGG